MAERKLIYGDGFIAFGYKSRKILPLPFQEGHSSESVEEKVQKPEVHKAERKLIYGDGYIAFGNKSKRILPLPFQESISNEKKPVAKKNIKKR